ncbi:hypothetical protein [Nocardioides insulae]|uniref:hypothetical protein n=1 Tax=Nocardioides insulae TaxID=394734 RepID=UPI0004028EE0|nr:hypothetical protein [Nocardioides insulae]
MDERPRSLILSLRVLTALIAVAGVTVILMMLRTDDLLRSWAEGNPDVRELLETQGLDAVLEGTVRPPQIVPVAIVMWVVMTALLWLLAIFVSNGFEWARVGITLLLGFTAIAAVGSIMIQPPALFIGCTVVCIALGVLCLVFLWHPATTRYIHADPEAV